MGVRLYGRSDVGRKRSSNEDSFVLCEDEGLGVVCDGMGGHEFGEIASRMAVDLFADRVSSEGSNLHSSQRKLSQTRALAQEMVHDWIQEANASIFERGQEELPNDPSAKAQMGTTLAMALFLRDFAVVANVGDSRVYRIRDGVIQQVSEDHIIVAEAKRHPADPRPARKRKYVTRALGTKPRVEPDISLVDTFPGDLFVLCSDGLTDLVDDDEIAKVLGRVRRDYRKAIRSLIDLANRRGGPDNVTVVISEVLGEESDEDEDTEPMKAWQADSSLPP